MHNMFAKFFLVVTTFTSIVSAQISLNGTCNNVTTQQDFNLTKFMGTWYEVAKYRTIFQSGINCISVDYSLRKDGLVEVVNSMSFFGHNVSVYGSLTEVNPQTKDGKLKLYFPDILTANSEYWVLGTDYTNYSVIWSCVQKNNSNDQFAWILSRTQNLTQEQNNAVQNLTTKNNLENDRFIPINQTHCHYKRKKCNNAAFPLTSNFILIAVAIMLIQQFV